MGAMIVRTGIQLRHAPERSEHGILMGVTKQIDLRALPLEPRKALQTWFLDACSFHHKLLASLNFISWLPSQVYLTKHDTA